MDILGKVARLNAAKIVIFSIFLAISLAFFIFVGVVITSKLAHY